MGSLCLRPVKVRRRVRPFNVTTVALRALRSSGLKLQDNDILAMSSKFVAVSQGRCIDLSRVKVSSGGHALSKRLRMVPELAELVLQEADYVYGGIPEFALTFKDGVMAPNAGIDRSNIFPGWAIMYPKDPFRSAENIRTDILERTGKRIGILITDSRLMPTRVGTTGVAVGVAGFEPISDERGRRDLFGNIMKVTQRALADDLSAAVQPLMGETDEEIPIVLTRSEGLDRNAWMMTERSISPSEIAIGSKKCIFIRGISKAGTQPWPKKGKLVKK